MDNILSKAEVDRRAHLIATSGSIIELLDPSLKLASETQK